MVAYFKLAGHSEFEYALLKLCNIKYAIRFRFFLIILTGMSKAWETFFSLNKAASLIVSSKATKWKLNLGWLLSFILSLIENIKWNQTMEMKQNQPFFHGTYSNLTPYLFYQKTLKYFNDFKKGSFSVLWLKWTKITLLNVKYTI